LEKSQREWRQRLLDKEEEFYQKNLDAARKIGERAVARVIGHVYISELHLGTVANFRT
jgi:hypothetical protein